MHTQTYTCMHTLTQVCTAPYTYCRRIALSRAHLARPSPFSSPCHCVLAWLTQADSAPPATLSALITTPWPPATLSPCPSPGFFPAASLLLCICCGPIPALSGSEGAVWAQSTLGPGALGLPKDHLTPILPESSLRWGLCWVHLLFLICSPRPTPRWLLVSKGLVRGEGRGPELG